MARNAKRMVGALAIAVISGLVAIGARAEAPPESEAQLPSVAEARQRARLLHETIHAMLHVVHHQYYREGEGLELPAAAFKNVFREVAQRQKVELRWLAVNAQAMNVEHQPRDEFEKLAVQALTSGNVEHEQVENGAYRRAGAILLSSECLKCHLPNRTSTAARTAGLVITMPVADR